MSKLKDISIDEIVEANPLINKDEFLRNIEELRANKDAKSRRTYYDIAPPFSRIQINSDK